MASRLSPGLVPSEIEFLCELESITVVPRRRLESLPLLSCSIPALKPPQRTDLPLWLALLLKRQKRVDIVPPRWLHPQCLSVVLERELVDDREEIFTSQPPLDDSSMNTPPFQKSSTAGGGLGALPFHWLDMGHILIDAAPDDVVDVEQVRRLLRDIREVRLAKIRAFMSMSDEARSRVTRGGGSLELRSGGGVRLNGIGAMELSEARSFVSGVIDGLRKVTASKEASDRERIEEQTNEDRLAGGEAYDNDDDDDMLM